MALLRATVGDINHRLNRKPEKYQHETILSICSAVSIIVEFPLFAGTDAKLPAIGK